ncbi:MAG: bifunctional 5,10-methylenetetrahydrofolate dehydrogenase/5,10-methenyltetrahydrofolate cyclohydrolase [Planctomycetota bacterium]|jgi:methylenetetrahydrofolate dehydrogenase (NADP+)/methenyltetrahydrofolate cyclohydrolase
MPAKLLEGAPLAEKIAADVKKGVEELKASKGVTPCLAAVQVGPGKGGIKMYLKGQQKAAEESGITLVVKEFPEDISESALIEELEKMNGDPSIHGILLLVPMPEQINPRNLQVKIIPAKDVEGMHPENMGKLFYGNQNVAPCTAMAAVELLLSSGLDLKGKEVAMVGHSEIVGKPVTMLLLQSLTESPTVTVCHIATAEAGMTEFHTKRADVVISAVGVKAGLITADMLKDGATVIDVATIQVPMLDENGNPVLNKKGKPRKRWVGDVEFDKAVEKCAFISPVPGGVGPITSSILMRNCLACARELS